MATQLQQMEGTHVICMQMVEQLKHNISHLFYESTRAVRRYSYNLESGAKGSADIYAPMAFNKFMSEVCIIANVVRRCNTSLQLASKTFHDWEDELSNEFSQWNSILDPGGIFVGFPKKEGIFQNKLATALDILPRRMNASFEKPESVSTFSSRYAIFEDLSLFTEGFEFMAMITHVQDLERLQFYVNLCQNDLTKLSKMTHLPRLNYLPNPDEIFGISVNNSEIMRAIVQPITSLSLMEIQLLLIDIGEVIFPTNFCKFYDIPMQYRQLPAQAIKCSLMGSDKPVSEEPNYRSYLSNILLSNKLKMVHFKVIQKSHRMLFLRILEEPSHAVQGKELNVKAKNYSTNPFLNPQEFECETNIPELEDNAFTCNTDEKEEINKNIFKSECPMQDSSLLVSTDIGKPNTNIEETKEDVILKITATFVSGVDCFYAQIEKDKYPAFPLFWSDNKVESHQRLLEPPPLHQLVLAQFAKDDFWYRAKVIQQDIKKGLFEVFYVDYGNTEFVPLNCLATCTHLEVDEPFRAVPFRLAGIQESTNGDDIRRQTAQDFLIVFILNQTFDVKVLKKVKNEYLIHIIDEDMPNVANILVDMGYAKKI